MKEVSKANGRKVENCSRIEEIEVQKIWKDYFEDFFNIDTQEQVAFHMCGFDGTRRGNYFGG